MGIGEQGDVRNDGIISAEKSVFCQVVFHNVQRMRPMNMAFFIFRDAFGRHFLMILNKPGNSDKWFVTVLFEKQPFICFGAFDPRLTISKDLHTNPLNQNYPTNLNL